MEPLNQLPDLVRARLGDVPNECIARRVVVIADRCMMVRTYASKAFTSIDFGFELSAGPHEHNSVRDSPPPFSAPRLNPPRNVWRFQLQRDLK